MMVGVRLRIMVMRLRIEESIVPVMCISINISLLFQIVVKSSLVQGATQLIKTAVLGMNLELAMVTLIYISINASPILRRVYYKRIQLWIQ